MFVAAARFPCLAALLLLCVHFSSFSMTRSDSFPDISSSSSSSCARARASPSIRFFGTDGEEMPRIVSAVEAAFEKHRQSLLALLHGVDKLLHRMDAIDARTHGRYASVHREMLGFAQRLPRLWERNEEVLREILQPLRLPLVSLIADRETTIHSKEGEILDEINTQTDEENENNKEREHTERTEQLRQQGQGGGQEEENRQADVAAYNSILQLLVHLNRDWTALGAQVRRTLYQEAILPRLRAFLPLSSPQREECTEGESAQREKRERLRVLVPGAGLNRLSFEIAALGYDVESNECSATMVAATHALFNLLLRREHREIYPSLHSPLQDDWDLTAREIQALFPFYEDSAGLLSAFPLHTGNHSTNNGEINRESDCDSSSAWGEMSVQLGDFVRVYGSHSDRRAQFAAIVTCFFIDTGEDVHEYLRTIRHVLRPGGLWINLGPLHYHSRQAVPYSLRHLLQVIELSGFEILENDKVEASYCGEDWFSMKPEVYRVPLTVFRMTDEPNNPVEAVSNASTLGESFHHTDYILKS